MRKFHTHFLFVGIDKKKKKNLVKNKIISSKSADGYHIYR